MAHIVSKRLDRKRRFWFKHIRGWQQADITQLQYCDKHNLSLAAFRWWRSRFLKDSTPQKPHEPDTVEVSPHFAEVSLPIKTEPKVTVYDYEIVLPNQTQLRLRHNCDPQVVSTLLSVLDAACWPGADRCVFLCAFSRQICDVGLIVWQPRLWRLHSTIH
jgi:hypothetical protein